jgi:hypothetical protein
MVEDSLSYLFFGHIGVYLDVDATIAVLGDISTVLDCRLRLFAIDSQPLIGVRWAPVDPTDERAATSRAGRRVFRKVLNREALTTIDTDQTIYHPRVADVIVQAKVDNHQHILTLQEIAEKGSCLIDGPGIPIQQIHTPRILSQVILHASDNDMVRDHSSRRLAESNVILKLGKYPLAQDIATGLRLNTQYCRYFRGVGTLARAWFPSKGKDVTMETPSKREPSIDVDHPERDPAQRKNLL